MKIEEMVKLVFADAAAINFRRDGYLQPYFFLIREGMREAKVIVPTDDKDETAAIVRAAVQRTGATLVVFVAEAWVMDLKGMDAEKMVETIAEADKAGVKSIPGHKEVLQVVAESKSGQRCCYTADIIRERPGDEDSKGTLGPWEKQNATEAHGRFSHLWTPERPI